MSATSSSAIPLTAAAAYPSSSTLSQRGQSFTAGPTHKYTEKVFQAFSKNSWYDRKTNKRGTICLCVAENKLCADLMLDKVKAFQAYSPAVLNYTLPSGLPPVRSALARFMGKRVFNGAAVDPEHLVVGAGVTSLLTQLSVLLFEPNDAVLVPAPYYPAFDADFRNLGGVVTVPVHSASVGPSFGEGDADLSAWLLDTVTEAALDEALAKATKNGHPPKALLLTNPGNPTGHVLTKKQLQTAVTWTRYRGLHLIVDEIYALSTYATDDDTPFVSIVEVLNNTLTNHVHVLWGVSKDFGASGLRLGVLYSHNAELLRALGATNMGFQVSNQVQETVAALVSDAPFVDTFFAENSRRLMRSYAALVAGLEPLGVKFVRPHGASIFVFADFRCLLSEQTFDAERRVFEALAAKEVLLTPGEACHCPVPGFFRVCFAWVELDVLEEALRRIKALALQKQDGCVVA
jgi:aspartate/methionine/tyrosine aminotransferase